MQVRERTDCILGVDGALTARRSEEHGAGRSSCLEALVRKKKAMRLDGGILNPAAAQLDRGPFGQAGLAERAKVHRLARLCPQRTKSGRRGALARRLDFCDSCPRPASRRPADAYRVIRSPLPPERTSVVARRLSLHPIAPPTPGSALPLTHICAIISRLPFIHHSEQGLLPTGPQSQLP